MKSPSYYVPWTSQWGPPILAPLRRWGLRSRPWDFPQENSEETRVNEKFDTHLRFKKRYPKWCLGKCISHIYIYIYTYISLQIESHVGYLSYISAVFYQNWLLNRHPPFLILLVVFVWKMACSPAAGTSPVCTGPMSSQLNGAGIW